MPLKRGPTPLNDPLPLGHEELAVTNGAAVALAGPAGSPIAALQYTLAWIEVETAPIRLWVDGGVPTTTAGHLYNPGQADLLGRNELRLLQAIATTGTAAILRVTYYRELGP